MSSEQRRGTAFRDIRGDRAEAYAARSAKPQPKRNRRGRIIEPAPAPAAKPQAPAIQPPAASSGPAPTETKVNANGVEQKGRNLSAVNLPGMEAYVGGGIANFAGPSFPTEPETNKITEGFLNTTVETAKNLVSPEAYKENLATVKGNALTSTNKPAGDFTGAPQATEGQPDPNAYKLDLPETAADGGTPPNKVGATLSRSRVGRDSDARGGFDPRFDKRSAADSEPVVEQGSNPSKSYSEMMRRRAFLDGGKGSMQALRDVERGMGMAYAGGQHYANVDGELKAMNKDDARDIKMAAPGEAQALKDRWVSALSESKTEEPQLASLSQDVEYETPAPKSSADFSKNAGDAVNSGDFAINNSEDMGKKGVKAPAIKAVQGLLGAFTK